MIDSSNIDELYAIHKAANKRKTIAQTKQWMEEHRPHLERMYDILRSDPALRVVGFLSFCQYMYKYWPVA